MFGEDLIEEFVNFCLEFDCCIKFTLTTNKTIFFRESQIIV